MPIGFEGVISGAVRAVSQLKGRRRVVHDIYRMLAEAQLSSFVSIIFSAAEDDNRASRDAIDVHIAAVGLSRSWGPE